MTKIAKNITDIIQDLNQQEKIIVIENLFFLLHNLEAIFGMTEPWLLIVDNQILNDLKYSEKNKCNLSNRNRYLRLIAVFMIFNFLVNYAIKEVGIVLTPCIFFEFNQRKIPKNIETFYSSLDDCCSLLNQFEIPILISEVLANYKTAKINFKNISHDEQRILEAVQKLKNRKMLFELYQKLNWDNESSKKSKIELFKPPLIIAYQLATRQKLKLKYFDLNIVNHIIACHLEDKVYSDSAKTKLLKTKIKSFRDLSINKMASVSKISKGNLKGLADIEMLQYCNISSQFNYDTDHTLFALTFDKKLAHLLQKKTGISISIEISRDDSDKDMENKNFNFSENLKRIELIESKSRNIFSKLAIFYEDIMPLFS